VKSTRHYTTCYFNVRSKTDMSQFNLPHGNEQLITQCLKERSLRTVYPMHSSAECNFCITKKLLIHTLQQLYYRLQHSAVVKPNSHVPPDTTKLCCLCRVRRCKLSLATVLQSLKSLHMDNSRRVVFGEEVSPTALLHML